MPHCIVKSGSVSVPIYKVAIKSASKSYPAFRMKCRIKGQSKPVQITRGDLDELKKEAKKFCDQLASASGIVEKPLTRSEVESFRNCAKLCANMGKTIEAVVIEYSQAFMELSGGVTVPDVARQWKIRNESNKASSKPVLEIVAEMLKAKKDDGLSQKYLSDLSQRLKKFGENYSCPLENVTGIDLWLRGLKTGGKTPTLLSPRSRNNFRLAIQTLVSFAKSRKYLSKEWDGLNDVALAKAKIETIHIFKPLEIAALLKTASEEQIPFIAIGAFAGLRTAEIQRLRWEHIRFESKYIEVTADNAKTASRRLVPIQPNLLAWLAPYRDRDGFVCVHANMTKQVMNASDKSGVKWRRNALRHSFISYRVAQTGNVANVALEAGNSPKKIFSNYRELVTPEEAEMWFKVLPETAESLPEQAGDTLKSGSKLVLKNGQPQ